MKFAQLIPAFVLALAQPSLAATGVTETNPVAQWFADSRPSSSEMITTDLGGSNFSQCPFISAPRENPPRH